jgi:hypothetical protein
LQHVRKDLGQGNPGVGIFEERLPRVIVLLPHMYHKRWLLRNKHIDQSSQHGRGVVDARISSLAEEVGQKSRLGHRLSQFVDDAAYQHHFAFAWIALHPQQSLSRAVAPSLELSILEHPAVRIQ